MVMVITRGARAHGITKRAGPARDVNNINFIGAAELVHADHAHIICPLDLSSISRCAKSTDTTGILCISSS